MSDNLQNRVAQDRARIVTDEELQQAVKKAGNSTEAVRQHLRTKH